MSRFVAPLPIRLWAWRKSDNRGRYEHSYGNVPMDALLTFPSGGKKERGEICQAILSGASGENRGKWFFFQAHSCSTTLHMRNNSCGNKNNANVAFSKKLTKSYCYYCRVNWRILESQAAIYSLCTCAHSICVLFPLPPPPKTPLGFPPPPPPFPFLPRPYSQAFFSWKKKKANIPMETTCHGGWRRSEEGRRELGTFICRAWGKKWGQKNLSSFSSADIAEGGEMKAPLK